MASKRPGQSGGASDGPAGEPVRGSCRSGLTTDNTPGDGAGLAAAIGEGGTAVEDTDVLVASGDAVAPGVFVLAASVFVGAGVLVDAAEVAVEVGVAVAAASTLIVPDMPFPPGAP